MPYEPITCPVRAPACDSWHTILINKNQPQPSGLFDVDAVLQPVGLLLIPPGLLHMLLTALTPTHPANGMNCGTQVQRLRILRHRCNSNAAHLLDRNNCWLLSLPYFARLSKNQVSNFAHTWGLSEYPLPCPVHHLASNLTNVQLGCTRTHNTQSRFPKPHNNTTCMMHWRSLDLPCSRRLLQSTLHLLALVVSPTRLPALLLHALQLRRHLLRHRLR